MNLRSFILAACILVGSKTALFPAEITPSSPAPRDRLIHVHVAEGERIFVLPWSQQTAPPVIEIVTTTTGELCWVGPPGVYYILGWTASGQSQQLFEIRDGITPQPPVPPGPGPGPTPPPGPGPAPFPAPGLSVIILREGQQVIPAAQSAIFNSSKVIGYLNSKCVKIEGSPAARIWDEDYTDAQLANTPAVLRDAYKATVKQANGQVPWIAISTGTNGFSGPLPANVDETMTLLKKYGG